MVGITTTILVLCVIFGITFVYAGMTQKLNIHGYATINSPSWDVHFENLSKYSKKGDIEELSTPVIQDNSTSISGYNVVFNTINDSITYEFEVVNNGDLDAEINSVTIQNPVCSGSGENKVSDENLVCNNIKYSLTYEDGSQVNTGDDILTNERVKMYMTLKYTGSTLPQNIVDISNLDITIIYSQK